MKRSRQKTTIADMLQFEFDQKDVKQVLNDLGLTIEQMKDIKMTDTLAESLSYHTGMSKEFWINLGKPYEKNNN